VCLQGKKKDCNVGFGRDYDKGSKDVEFIRQLIEKIVKNYTIAANSIFATGLSIGGFFTHRLTIEMPEVLRLLLPLVLQFLIKCKKRHTYKQKISVLLVPGDADGIVKYVGKKDAYNSAEETIKYWKKYNKSTLEVSKEINTKED
jgi:polyhydroxybutyrate depolymerase